ncbi:MAG: two-component system sensor protein [Deltaproteobacteria bacterium]|nr:two-component system sensor protein [Deltaproteobacteria bacterium]
MDLRTQTALLAAILSLALGVSVLLRGRTDRQHVLFVVFGLNLTAYYLATFFLKWAGGEIAGRAVLVAGVLLPQVATRFFGGFLGVQLRPQRLTRVAAILGVPAVVLVASPYWRNSLVEALIGLYVFGLLFASLYLLWVRSKHAESRADRARIGYLVVGGLVALTFSAADFLPQLGVQMPPLGDFMTLFLLFVISQALIRYRLLDLYELIGRLAVLLALALSLAAIFYVLVRAVGRTESFFINATVASLVILIVFDPLRDKVEQKISEIFFRERFELERRIGAMRRRLAHTLEIDEMCRLLLSELEATRRVTHVSLYLLDADRRGFDLVGCVGPRPVERLELASVRPLMDRLKRSDAVVLDELDRELGQRRERGIVREVELVEEVRRAVDSMRTGVCLALTGEEGILGLLNLKDERLRDAFTFDEVMLLKGLATQVAITIDNTKLYAMMKERDRLAALGQMAAGLAHEIRNPLGAIKASAQYLEDPRAETPAESTREFLDIIVDEVNRLNRVVSSFLDYARPSKGNPVPIDLGAALRRTLEIMQPGRSDSVEVVVDMEDGLPLVAVDAEQIRQVFMNLVQNAVQAMEGRGKLTITGAFRPGAGDGGRDRIVEIRFTDTGPAISPTVMRNLFVPFFTTKDKGTGLGLAISQRIVQSAGGTIQVRTQPGGGTTFTVVLPASETSEVL